MKLCLATLVRKMASLENSDQRYKVIDHCDLAEFLREDMIDQLRGEEMTLGTLSGEIFTLLAIAF